MNTGITTFSQIMDFLPMHEFRKYVQRYNGNHKVKSFSYFELRTICVYGICSIDLQRKPPGYRSLPALIDLRGCIPSFIKITDGKVHDVNILDELVPEPGSVYVMDRGYLDFARLYTIHLCFVSVVIRSKKNLKFQRLYSHPIDKSTYDWTLVKGSVSLAY